MSDIVNQTFTGRPLFEAENEIASLADKMGLLESYLADRSDGLSPAELRAVTRIAIEAAADARAIEMAWHLEFGAIAWPP